MGSLMGSGRRPGETAAPAPPGALHFPPVPSREKGHLRSRENLVIEMLLWNLASHMFVHPFI